ncbi:hypothetical protein [Vibrio ishigakensis]|uniref:hypothetical protein n=1 Tax=Vibrio ishigakensis TaxID=1481914 RepID=UPI0021C4B8BC|nr:hypothetical protein [Vibrio ishigakensis]
MDFSSNGVSFSTKIEDSCGIQVHDATGDIIFENGSRIIYDDTAKFEVMANTSSERANVRFTNVETSQAIGDDYLMLVRGNNGERKQFNHTYGGVTLGNGEYEAVVKVNKSITDMPSGTHYVSGTLEIECGDVSIGQFQSSRIK